MSPRPPHLIAQADQDVAAVVELVGELVKEASEHEAKPSCPPHCIGEVAYYGLASVVLRRSNALPLLVAESIWQIAQRDRRLLELTNQLSTVEGELAVLRASVNDAAADARWDTP